MKATKQKKEEKVITSNFIKGQKVLITQGIYSYKVGEIFDYNKTNGEIFVIIDNCFIESLPPFNLQSIKDHDKKETE